MVTYKRKAEPSVRRAGATRKKTRTSGRTRPVRKTKTAPKKKVSKPRRSPMEAEAMRQLAVYSNPFSRATSDPKIPDGGTTLSVGVRDQQVLQLTNAPNQDVMHLILFPGLDSGLYTFRCAEADTTRVGASTHTRAGLLVPWQNSGRSATAAAATSTTWVDNSDVAAWRSVSTGLRLKLLNPVEEDDGWWESYRFKMPMTANQYSFVDADNGDTTDDLCLGPNANMVTNYLMDDIMVNNPTYQSGLLRDLDKMQFSTRPIGKDIEFKHPAKDLIATGFTWAWNASLSEFVLAGGQGHATDFVRERIDSHHDCVYIRLHCRPNAGSTTGSRFLTHVIGNKEFIYEPDQREAQFHTDAHNAGAAFQRVHENTQNRQAPAEAVLSNSMVIG